MKLELNEKTQIFPVKNGVDFLHLLEVGYEPFYLTGDEGVLDEIDEIVAEQQISSAPGACS